MIPSEYRKRLKFFFCKFHHFYEIAEIIFFENFPPAFFNILKEPLLVQKQTIHQQKPWDLSYLEPDKKGHGMVKRVPRPLAAKDIEKKSKFDGAKSGRKKIFFRFIFYYAYGMS